MTCEFVAELATGHGGDVELAARMIRESAAAGAHTVKVQSYSLDALNPADPQAAWLRQAWLSEADHQRLMQVAKERGVQFLATPFDPASLVMLRGLGLTRFKIASSTSRDTWWEQLRPRESIVSFPWGLFPKAFEKWPPEALRVTAIPLYPTPLECVQQATMLDGFSCHCVGTAAALWAITQGIKYLEVHVTIEGARKMPFDKSMDDVRQLRNFIEDMTTMRTGVSRVFRERWIK